METEEYKEVERRFRIAEARFDVADQLGWVTAFFAGTTSYFKWYSWIYAIIAFVVVFIVATYRERKEYNIASNLYNQANED